MRILLNLCVTPSHWALTVFQFCNDSMKTMNFHTLPCWQMTLTGWHLTLTLTRYLVLIRLTLLTMTLRTCHLLMDCSTGSHDGNGLLGWHGMSLVWWRCRWGVFYSDWRRRMESYRSTSWHPGTRYLYEDDDNVTSSLIIHYTYPLSSLMLRSHWYEMSPSTNTVCLQCTS